MDRAIRIALNDAEHLLTVLCEINDIEPGLCDCEELCGLVICDAAGCIADKRDRLTAAISAAAKDA